MKYKNYKLNILVNDKPLREYKIPDSDLGFSINTAQKSYVLDKKKRKIISPLTTFVAVPKPGTPYKIQYSTADGGPYKAKVFVDGQNDKGYTHFITDMPFIKEGFCNKDCSMRHQLVFDKTEWTDYTDESNVKYGGLGIISVYFYKAKFVKRIGSDYRRLKLGRDLKQVKVSETKSNIDITLTTKFDGGEVIKKPKPSEDTLTRTDKEPIAVLHINYRPVDWFISKGISVKQSLVVDFDVPIKIENVPIGADKNKHNYREIVELIDTDDTDTDDETMKN
ncbi:hypothetical protein C1645_756493 [Glomus cerebriforme]|uniref:Uncharacterized protein n=1 Tax=Glomus cerebriforme TaxID=658196 RepID=A0A397TH92_9GLOM|nr:hypothetical protein C1645_756493 [Glomus cerebriforme]